MNTGFFLDSGMVQKFILEYLYPAFQTKHSKWIEGIDKRVLEDACRTYLVLYDRFKRESKLLPSFPDDIVYAALLVKAFSLHSPLIFVPNISGGKRLLLEATFGQSLVLLSLMIPPRIISEMGLGYARHIVEWCKLQRSDEYVLMCGLYGLIKLREVRLQTP